MYRRRVDIVCGGGGYVCIGDVCDIVCVSTSV